MTSTLPQISIIISVYNHVEWLEMVLTALDVQTMKQFEVVLADDGSNEQSREYVSKIKDRFSFCIQHVWQEDAGWRKDRILNQAIVASKGEYLIVLDGDCIPDSHFVEDHWTLRSAGKVVAGRRAQLPKQCSDSLTVDIIRKKGAESLAWSVLWHRGRHCENAIRLPKWMRRLGVKPKRGLLLGCNFSMYKSDLLLVNGFDERYEHPATGEDTDLELRLGYAGIEVWRYRMICRVFHRFHTSAGADGAGDGNGEIFAYNKQHHISYTPWGINKEKLTSYEKNPN